MLSPLLPATDSSHKRHYDVLLRQALHVTTERERSRIDLLTRHESLNYTTIEQYARALSHERRHHSIALALEVTRLSFHAKFLRCDIHAAAEISEEARMNNIIKNITTMKKDMNEERGRVVMELEREEERISNRLMLRLEEVTREKRLLECQIDSLVGGVHHDLMGEKGDKHATAPSTFPKEVSFIVSNDNSAAHQTSAIVNLHQSDESLESMRESFQQDGFVVFHCAIEPSFVNTLKTRLDKVLQGQFNRGSPPDKMPLVDDSDTSTKSGKSSRVLQLINVHKCDDDFRRLSTSPEIGRVVAQLAGWKHGARLAQDQVWIKPPGAPALVFHRDSPYFMFTPDDIVTVWIALDDMEEELGPLEYVRGSHRWGPFGGPRSFYGDRNRELMYSAAQCEGICDPESNLDIVSMKGLKAGGISVHHGKMWHGSAKNTSTERMRRGLGLHFVPMEVRFTKDARSSSLWRAYVPENATDEDLSKIELPEADFPVAYAERNI